MPMFICRECKKEKGPCYLTFDEEKDNYDLPTTCAYLDYQKNNNIEEMKSKWEEINNMLVGAEIKKVVFDFDDYKAYVKLNNGYKIRFDKVERIE